METDDSTRSCIVTFREVERIFTGREANDALAEAAQKEQSPHEQLENAKVLAQLGGILKALEKAQTDAGRPDVMATPQHGPASRLQSLIASGEAADLKFETLASGALEAKFDTRDWIGWASVALAKIKGLIPHHLLRPVRATADAFPDTASVAMLGDWGTGLYGAPVIAETLKNQAHPHTLLMHLGDIYYAGTEKETQQRFISMWPMNAAQHHRALNGNHEMYSGGKAYFEKTLPAFRQDASYFAFQNAHWTLVGLDVAHKDHDIDDEQAEWLSRIVAAAGNRKVVLFSHHQLFSHFESQGRKLWEHATLGGILQSGKIFAWYWGHEHRCCIYERRDSRFNLWGRCIGHGGMPFSRKLSRDLPTAIAGNGWRWMRSAARDDGNGNLLPSAIVLDGPNLYIPEEEDAFLPNGYATLHFDGPKLVERVRDPAGAVLWENTLAT